VEDVMKVPTDPLYTEKDGKQSKKFLAAMRFTRDWTAIIILTIIGLGLGAYFVEDKAIGAGIVSVLIAEIVVLGFVQVLYLGGQAAVDTFVRMAVVIVTGKNGNALKGHTPPAEPALEDDPTS
jgi:hypothetical protein